MRFFLPAITFAALLTALPSAATPVPAAAGQPPAGGTISAIRLSFQEQEPGTEAYVSRYIVTDRYLRIDDGVPYGDFILLDRRTRTIYSANDDDRTILVIQGKERHVHPPMKLVASQRQSPLPDAPAVAGRKAEHHTLLTNGKICYDVVAVPGLLDKAVAALREYRLVLASENQRMVPLTPADVQDACDLAHNAFWPVRYLRYGMPIQEWSPQGYHRRLLDYDETYQVSASLFVLPKGYRRYTMEVSAE